MADPPAEDAPEAVPHPRQLALDLAPGPSFDPEDFLVSGSNERAYALVETWPDWPDPVLLLIGPPGSGKSHLGAIWAAKAGARRVSATGLAAADLDAFAATPLLIEDLDRAGLDQDAFGSNRLKRMNVIESESVERDVGGGPVSALPRPALVQAPLFHLLNLVRERGPGLLLTARTPPEAWGLALADLVSRLRLAPRAEIGHPDDALMRAVLVKLLVERQLVVDTRLVDYAALRLGRSLDAARRFVEEIDRRALSRKARITRTLAAEVLRALESLEEAEDRTPRA